ncbi:ribonuclease P protein subunit p25 [Ahaetulla prasina]|uniref:ribonuclease P protein subunit p25 n=1 Tax=Ahaetulla prasina TaxID=499056 RepID=UPI0026490D99|nr:ribonuclease P protein subunit p25 [Ahaetulla prasina]
MQLGDSEPGGTSTLTEGPPTTQRMSSEAAEAASALLPAGPPAAVVQSRMENFRKVKTSEQGSPLPFSDLQPHVVEMKVKEGSKIRNLMGFAMARMEKEEIRQIVFSGCGRAVTKTITCVEIMKRKLGGLHQVTKLQYRTLVEVWENQGPRSEGPPEHLTVHKNVPSIYILLSKDLVDPNQMGYQAPSPPGSLWAESRISPKATKRRLLAPHEED